MENFQRFEKLIKEAFKRHSECFDFEGFKANKAVAEDIFARQTLVDYCIEELMDLKHDDQIIEEIGNHIKFEIAPAIEQHIRKLGSTMTLKYTDEYHDAMLMAQKNTLDKKAITEIVTDNNIFYLMPYKQKYKDIIKGKIAKEDFRFCVIVINK